MSDKSDLDGWLQGLSQIVNETLWRDWDPSDVNDEADTKDEYKPFVPEIVRLLINDATPAEVADCLWRFEEETLKLSISTADTVEAANSLVNEYTIYSDEHPRPQTL